MKNEKKEYLSNIWKVKDTNLMNDISNSFKQSQSKMKTMQCQVFLSPITLKWKLESVATP